VINIPKRDDGAELIDLGQLTCDGRSSGFEK